MDKMRTTAGLILCLALLVAASATVTANLVFIDLNKNGVLDAGEWNGTSIQAAVDNATAGDVIKVEPGVYKENVIINTSIILKGDPTIDAIGGVGIQVAANNTRIENMTVFNGTKGIFVYNSTIAAKLQNVEIVNCTVHDISDGGIVLRRVNNSAVVNCTSYSNGAGVRFVVATNSKIIGCTVYANTNFGIRLRGSDNNLVSDNNATRNTQGISLKNSDNNVIRNNVVVSSANWGAYLNNSLNNLIYNNYFNNTNNAYDDGNNRWNESVRGGVNIVGGLYIGGNYWNDYRGTDTDGDGLGDTLLPYNSSGNIAAGGDRHPLLVKVRNLDTGEWYGSIQAAINAASDGDVVKVFPGIYKENVVINKRIVLTGDPIINAAGGVGIWIKYNDTLVENFIIYNATKGIYAYNSTHYLENVTVNNCTVYDSVWGIHFQNVLRSLINDSNVTKNVGYGVSLDVSDLVNITHLIAKKNHVGVLVIGNANTISKSYFYDNDYGVGYSIARDCLLNDSTFVGNDYGAYLLFSTDDVLHNVTFTGNMQGAVLDKSDYNMLLNINANGNVGNNTIAAAGIRLKLSERNILINISVSNNRGVAGNPGYGIVLDSSNHNAIVNIVANSNQGTGYGVYLNNSDYNTFSNVVANKNDYGVYLLQSDHNLLNGSYLKYNSYGMYLNMSQNNTLTNFTVVYNYNYGIYLKSQPPTPSKSNLIYNNYFENVNNAYDIATNRWNVTPVMGKNIIGGSWRGGNYWSDYAGSDVTGDGLGDTLLPYNSGIVYGGDMHPLVVNNTPPSVSFTYTPQHPKVGEIIKFYDTSFDTDGYIVSWHWNFGDGYTSNERNTTHWYASPGNYTVMLTVMDDKGATNTTSVVIRVNNTPPTASFYIFPTDPTTADVIQFVDTSFDPDGYIVSWSWNFGDGNTSNLRNPTHQYATNGTYTVTLTVTDNSGATNTTSLNITVGETPPIASFTYSPLNPTTADTIQFTDTSFDPDGYIVSWSWNFGDGNTSSLRNPTHQYAANGTYTVTLTVTDNDGHSSSVSALITVGEVPPIASFYWIPSIPTVIDAVQFLDTSFDPDGYIVSWQWDFGDGNTSNLRNPTHQYAANGTYTVTLTVTDNDGHTSSVSANITIRNISPSASFTFTPTIPTILDTVQFSDQSTDYDGYIVSWSWNFGDGNTSSLRNPTHQYSTPGTYTVTLTVTDNAGAKATVSKNITIRNISPSASFTYTPLDPNNRNTIQFVDTSFDPDGYIVSWQWNFGDGNTSNLRNPTHQYAANGTYTVTLTVTDNAGAKATVSKNITVNIIAPIAAFTFTPLDPTNTETVHFSDQSTDYDGYIVSWQWNFGDGNTSSLRNPTHQYSTPGTYTVTLTVTDNSGATSTVTKTVTVVNVPPSPSFTINPSDPVTQQPVQFDDKSFDPDGYIVSWSWNFGDGYTSNLRNPTHAYASPGTYTVTLTVTDNGGAKSTVKKTITVQTPVSYPPETPREMPKPPVASFTYTPSQPSAGQTVTFDASSSYDEDGSISIYQWNFGDGSVAFGKVVNHTFRYAGSYKVDLIVIDDTGLQDTTWQIVKIASSSSSTKGDLDSNNVVNFDDLVATLNLILNNGYNSKADMNNDGKITFDDLVAVLNLILQG